MSTTPPDLATLGRYWTSQGGVNLGVVGNQRHCAGYHLGKDRIYGSCACRPDGVCEPGNGANDYSVKTARDRAGLTNYASAIDLGKLDGTLANLQDFSSWLVGRARANAPGTSDLREIIYSPDGSRVYRWDRERGYGSAPVLGGGDNSHLTHTHISFYRDSRTRNKVPIFSPYFVVVEDEMKITAQVRQAWSPTRNATTGESNGVLRATPDRAASIVVRVPVGTIIVTVAEIEAAAGEGPDWRLVEWAGRDPLYMLRSDWVAGYILPEPKTP